ncbi:MAG TPA: family 16 glycosylhydrolase [Propionicimonas sp.]|uniref:glycoside hydrolase family 16 protein n=1 Tax=Propionicimonas sp. TaxID=1955623 RepID=UPI002F421579
MPTATASASPGAPTPSASPSATVSPTPSPPAVPDPNLSLNLSLDKKATVSVSLASGAVSARFRTKVAKRRPVSLQRKVDGVWIQIATSRMSASGRVSFRAGTYQQDSVYRAVELPFRIKKKLAPARATKTFGWNLTLGDSFDGQQLDEEKWLNLASGARGPRYCSQSLPEMSALSGGALVGSVDYEKDSAVVSLIEGKARKAQEVEGRPVAGCDAGHTENQRGVFRTSMISTRNRAIVNTGTSGMVAARVKLPESQGMHGAVWLQSINRGELDMVEGFGYGRGISNYIHTASKKTLAATGKARYKLGAYVKGSSTRKRSWWSRYHTYSMAWDSTGFTFRVDGSVSQRVKIRPGNVDYYLVLSLLVSDWEAYRITNPVRTKGFKDVTPAQLPEQMLVDWVRVWKRA